LTRIVSLLPSATEMVCAVGCEDELVGVSHECDWPRSVVGKPVLTSSKVPVTGTSGEIDADVRSVIRAALAVYDIDEQGLAAANPDVIVTQDLCDVCAVSFDDVVAATARLTRDDVRIINLHPMRLADIWADIRKVGEALGRAEAAATVLGDMDARVEAVRSRAAALHSRPAVLTVEWIDPVMVGGTWMPELVALAGGVPLVTKPGDHAPTLDDAQLDALDPAPDVVIVKPCGFGLERTRGELDALRELLASRPWPALGTGRVWVADGNAYFNRPGPRIVDSLEILAACVHPEAFEDLAEQHADAFFALDFAT
jgi:iron complex transport system substrate-binding protein